MNKVISSKKREPTKAILFLFGLIVLLQIVIILCICTISVDIKALANVKPTVEHKTVYVKETTQKTETEGAAETTATPPAVTEAGPEEDVPEYDEMTFTATAYCPCAKCCGKCDGITATGTKATAGRTIAVDPSFIPYGTEIIIAGNTYIAEDCGGAVKGNNRVDIFFDTHAEALQFGRQTVSALVVKK